MLSNYSRNKILDHWTGVATFTAPTAIWCTVLTDLASQLDLINGSFAAEPSGGGFARLSINQSLDTTAPDFHDTGTPGELQNNGIWTIGTASGADWGNIAWGAIVDSGTLGAGNILDFWPASINRNVLDGDTLRIDNQTVNFRCLGEVSTYSSDAAIKHLLGIASWTVAGQHTGLGTGEGNLATNSFNLEETAGNYARQDAGSAFAAASGGSAVSNAALTWAAASADYSGESNHGALMDAATVGNVLSWTPITTPQTFVTGEQPRTTAGNLVLTAA